MSVPSGPTTAILLPLWNLDTAANMTGAKLTTRTSFSIPSAHRQASSTPLSDRRDTLLLHIFCRLDPQWALEYRSRHGWNRKVQPYYTEFDVDLIGTLRSSWHIKLSYQHRENDHHRFAVNLQLAGGKPDQWKSEHAVPKLSF
jgi:hypothetical protein